MEIQYEPAILFTLGDFAFPTNGIKAEATSETKQFLITDVDVAVLRDINQFGSGRILFDQSSDIYHLTRKKINSSKNKLI